MTKYGRIAFDLRARICSGEYGPGDKLPTTTELCRRYDVSKITVRRAMDELERDGLVARRRGSGTFVKGGAHAYDASSVSSTPHSPFPADEENGRPSQSCILRSFLAIHPPVEKAAKLHIDPDAFVYSIVRTRGDEDCIDVVEHTLIPMQLCPSLRESHSTPSLGRSLVELAQLRIASLHQLVVAVHPEDRIAEWLGVSQATAVLSVEQLAYLDAGQPCAYSVAIHAPSYEFTNVSSH